MAGLANIASAIGGGLQGFSNGLQLRQQWDQNQQRKQTQEVNQAAISDAEARRNADIDAMIGGNSDGTYSFEGKNYKTQDEARSAASSSARSLVDYYTKYGAPKIVENYLKNGDVAHAELFQQFISNQKTQEGMNSWANAIRSYNLGDDKGFIKHYTEAYNNEGYYGDGGKAYDGQAVKDSKGNTIGYQVKIKDSDGNEHVETIQNTRDAVESAFMFMSPDAVYKQMMARIGLEDKTKAAMALQATKANAAAALETQKQSNRAQLSDRNSENRRQEIKLKSSLGVGGAAGAGSKAVNSANAIATALKQNAGFSDDQIKQLYPELLGIYRKGMSQQERLMKVYDMMNNNLTDTKFQTLSREDKLKAARQMMIQMDQYATGADGQEDTPAQGQQQQDPTAGKGLPIFGRDGQITNQ